ncbi:hypothetical protein CGZ80_12675 [Rhodopirellula sp. MGV]|nr:hypothetical protein CGZ80_12675 [Rhodopirellula sp. MGV]PNY35669.1 hypothetical protein C2E31_17030 [Rhodopirellula baltica]
MRSQQTGWPQAGDGLRLDSRADQFEQTAVSIDLPPIRAVVNANSRLVSIGNSIRVLSIEPCRTSTD